MSQEKVTAVLSAVDKGFSSTLKSALGVVDSLGSKIKSGFAFGILTGAGQAAFSAITNGARNMVSEIDSSNAAWKNFESNLKMLEMPVNEIDAAKKELQDFATKTVYSASDMATTFSQLAAVGVKDTGALVKAFGGLAAASENPQQAMKTLSTQATQMAAKPTVAWADFKLMLEQTPAGIAAIAKEMGMSASEMVTAVQEGEIATNDFFDAIKRAGGAGTELEKLAQTPKTMGQAMDGLTEGISNKLLPAFDVLSQKGIGIIEGLSGSLKGINAQGLADKVTRAVDTVVQYWGILREEFSGVGTAVSDAFSTVREAIGEAFGNTDPMETFKTVAGTVADAIKTVAGFITENKDVIAKYAPLVAKLAIAFGALAVVNSVAPGLTRFAGSLAQMAGKGIVGLAAKLFGVAGGQTAMGTASATSAVSVMQSALATLALGAAVALAAAGLALIVQSAIALASAGWPAVAALAGLVGVVALLAVGASALGPGLAVAAPGLIAFGAAIALVGAGCILAGAALAIVASALPAIVTWGAQSAPIIAQLGAAMFEFGAGALVAGAAAIVLGAGLLVVAAAAVALGAGVILIATGAVIAGAALAIFASVLPIIASTGMAGASAVAALGSAFIVFAAGSSAGAIAAAAFGVAIAAAAIGAAAMAVALVGVTSQMRSISKSAKSAEKSLDNMQDSVGVVEAGLDALGSMADSVMDAITKAFDGAASDAKASATKLTTGFSSAFKSGMAKVPSVAKSATAKVTSTLRAGYSGTYSAGAYTSIGFANGMRSQLAYIRSAAAQMVAAADAAVRAKARISSPSKVSTALGAFWGEGFANGISDMTRDVRAATSKLVAIPNVATPDLAMAYGGEMSADYDYYRNATYRFDVSVPVDGREVARATVTYTQAELDRHQTRENRKHGRV